MSSLYNKMRPRHFSEVLGQEMVTENLKAAIQSGNISHSMLFTGERGTGKTTVAKIVARLINCQHPVDGRACDECESCKRILDGTDMDIVELDAASHNGVDDVRKIIESSKFQPLGKYKIFILDEVHMLSTSAFNALLKIMEEPPETVVFILCTTEVHKIPKTIMSRCVKFNFKTISDELIMQKLSNAGVPCEEGALRVVARAAKGSMRDAESIFEPFYLTALANGTSVTENQVLTGLGIPEDEAVGTLIDSIASGDTRKAYEVVDSVYENGLSLRALMERSIDTLLDIIHVQMGMTLPASRSNDYRHIVEGMAAKRETDFFLEVSKIMKNALSDMKGTGNASVIFKTCIIDASYTASIISALQKRVAALEKAISSGVSLDIKVEAMEEKKQALIDNGFVEIEKTPFDVETSEHEEKTEMKVSEVKEAPKPAVIPNLMGNIQPKAEVKTEVKPVVLPNLMGNIQPKAEVKAEPKPVMMPNLMGNIQPKAEVKPVMMPNLMGNIQPKAEVKTEVKPVVLPNLMGNTQPKAEVKAESKPVVMPNLNNIQPVVNVSKTVQVVPVNSPKKITENETNMSNVGVKEEAKPVETPNLFAPFADVKTLNQSDLDELKSFGCGISQSLEDAVSKNSTEDSSKKPGPLDLSAFGFAL